MKISKILAGMSAMAIAASAMAVSANAAIAEGTEMYDITAKFAELDGYLGDITAEDIAGVRLTLTSDDFSYFEKEDGTLSSVIAEDGFGGGVMLNSSVGGWNQVDNGSWGNDEQANNVVVTVDGDTATYTIDIMFAEKGYTLFDDVDVFGEVIGKNEDGTDATGYAQICVQEWWGGDLSIEYTLLDADGNDLLAPAEQAKREAEAQAALDKLNTVKADLTIVENLKAAASAISGIDDIMASADAEIAKLQAAIDEADAAFAALQDGDDADLVKACADAKAEFEANIKAISDAKAELQAAKDALDEKNAAEKKELEDQIADLNKQIEDLKADAQANADKIAALEAEKADLEKQLEEAKKNPPAASDKDTTADKDADKDEVPDTGVAVALGGIALAAAGVVVSKKRK